MTVSGPNPGPGPGLGAGPIPSPGSGPGPGPGPGPEDTPSQTIRNLRLSLYPQDGPQAEWRLSEL